MTEKEKEEKGGIHCNMDSTGWSFNPLKANTVVTRVQKYKQEGQSFNPYYEENIHKGAIHEAYSPEIVQLALNL